MTQAQLTNPNLILQQDAAKRKILSTTSLTLSSIAPDKRIAAPNPDLGGGTDNIALLTGKNAPNAVAPAVTTTFWIEELEDGEHQIQYTQRVLLNFSKLSWPHISVGTLTLLNRLESNAGGENKTHLAGGSGLTFHGNNPPYSAATLTCPPPPHQIRRVASAASNPSASSSPIVVLAWLPRPVPTPCAPHPPCGPPPAAPAPWRASARAPCS